jgi:HEAT repeat protein
VFEHHDVAAAEALGRIGDKRALGPLVTVFEWWHGHRCFPDPKFLEAMERAIVQFGDQAIGKLERLARKSPGLQSRMFYALGHSSSQRAVQILIEQMRAHSYPVADVLASMGDSPRAHLFHLATDETHTANSRRAAARALSNSHGALQEEGRRIAEAFYRDHTQTLLRKKIAFVAKGDFESEVADPVNALIALLKHPTCAKRRAAVDLLAELDAKTAAPDIAQLSNDERWQVRASVARVLARWGTPEEALQRLRQDPDIIVRGCTRWLR